MTQQGTVKWYCDQDMANEACPGFFKECSGFGVITPDNSNDVVFFVRPESWVKNRKPFISICAKGDRVIYELDRKDNEGNTFVNVVSIEFNKDDKARYYVPF